MAPSSPQPSPLMPERLENDSAEGAEGEVEPEAEALGSTNSEPGTPRAGRPAARAGGGSRAERCAGVHISDPYNVNLPLHITSILNVPPNIISNVSLARLTRGLECPALQPRGSPVSGPGPGPSPPGEDPGIVQDWEWGLGVLAEALLGGRAEASAFGFGWFPSAAIPGSGLKEYLQRGSRTHTDRVLSDTRGRDYHAQGGHAPLVVVTAVRSATAPAGPHPGLIMCQVLC